MKNEERKKEEERKMKNLKKVIIALFIFFSVTITGISTHFHNQLQERQEKVKTLELKVSSLTAEMAVKEALDSLKRSDKNVSEVTRFIRLTPLNPHYREHVGGPEIPKRKTKKKASR